MKDDIKRLAEELTQKEPKGLHLLVNNGSIYSPHALVSRSIFHSWYRSRQSHALFRCREAGL